MFIPPKEEGLLLMTTFWKVVCDINHSFLQDVYFCCWSTHSFHLCVMVQVKVRI